MLLVPPIDEALWARMKALDKVADFYIARMDANVPGPNEDPMKHRGGRNYERSWRVWIRPRDRRPGQGVSCEWLELKGALEKAVELAEQWDWGSWPATPAPPTPNR